MKMRKWMYVFIVASVILTFVGGAVADEGAEDDYMGEMMGHGMKHPMMGKSKGMMGMPPIMNTWEDLQEKLVLTDEQAEKFRKLYSEYRKEVMRKRVEIEIAEMDLMEQLRSKDANDKAIEDITNKIQSSWSALNSYRVKTLLKTKSFLSDKQYQELVHFIMDWRGPYGMRGLGYGWH